MTYSVAELCAHVSGALHGDGAKRVSAAVPLDEAHAEAISFLSDKRQHTRLVDCAAGALILPVGVPIPVVPTIVVDDPLRAMVKIAALFAPAAPKIPVGVDSRAAVASSATVATSAMIAAFAVVEDHVEIGEGCVLHPHAVVRSGCKLGNGVEIHPHAVLYPNTIVGDRSIIHSGAIIGCDGFGYQFRGGVHQKIPQQGFVRIGADVEIGANSTIDRATFGATVIGDGSKIDNQVQIAHNCKLGKHNIFVAQAGMAGSSTTGDYVILAGQVGIADHLHLGTGAKVGAGSGVYTDIPEGATYVGYPARPEREAKRHHFTLEKVPELRKQVQAILKHLNLTVNESDSSDDAGRASRRREAG